MRSYCRFACCCLALLALPVVADAQLYWDIDTGNVVGAGSTTPSGIWSVSAAHWNSDSTGAGVPTIWSPGSTAIFAAGSNATGEYTVTVSGTQSLAGLTAEEGTVTLTGGTLNFGSTAASIFVSSNAALGETSTEVYSGSGGLFKYGPGVLSLRGNNGFTRGGSGNQPFLTVNDGILDFIVDANLGAVPVAADNGAALTLNGGTLRFDNISNVTLAKTRGLYIGSNGGTIQVVNDVVLALAANASAGSTFSGSGTLTKSGPGRFLLQTAQTTFTGKYVITGGSLTFTNQNQFGAIPATTQTDYFTLNGGGLLADTTNGVSIDPKRGVTLGPNGGYMAFTGSGLQSYTGIISGAQGGALRLTTNDALNSISTGTITLSSANTYNGPTQIDTGMTLSVGILANGGVNSGIGSSSNAAANLILNGGKLSYTGSSVSIDRNFTVTGAGGYIDASSPDNSTLTFSSTAPITWADNATHLFILSGSSSGDNTFSPAITDFNSNATTLDKTDAGTWVLKNTANSYTGPTILSAGRLKLGAAGAIPDASIVQFFTTSVLDLNGFDETVKSISGSSGTLALGSKTLTLNNPAGETFAAAITGTGGGRIIKNGTGKLTLSPTSATYDGGLIINGGALGVGSAAAFGTGTLTINSNITLDSVTSTPLAFTNPVTLGGNVQFDDYTFGTTAGAISWTTSGTNKWTITGAPRSIVVSSVPGTYGVTINQTITEDVAGRNFTKGGNGLLTLTAVNTYTGNTIITDGTLAISQPYLSDTSNVVLSSLAKLKLNFSVGTPDTVAALYIAGVQQANGLWGAVGSGADHESAQILGTGLLQVGPVITAIPGDYNGDGQIDARDYVLWRKSPDAHGNSIGYDAWRASFGNSLGGGTNAGLGGGPVPEPTCFLLAIAGLAAFSTCRRPSRY